ncbi:GrpB family protein [Paenibacillus sp. YPG26]|uniref:GrpB family protein n=1 Tax=Paenibacillus sp. YPG26 TaxID=2878915 RepID=UPI00203FC70C|nr:GrpB family protein [Paenibacillus sp. YPG26]USB33408.1 GrpB family protein [Paenibacillus sp. YPG26]
MDQQWRIAPYEPQWWTGLFVNLGTRLRASLGSTALRIDHVGSTSVVGLDAKPIIDIQISVQNFDVESDYKSAIERLGYKLREENTDKTKKYFRELPGHRRTHIHVRQAGSFSEQMTLLFRDYLRVHPEDCSRYVQEKHRLMGLYNNERSKYVEGKGPIVWDILRQAHIWSQTTGWRPGRTDA